MEMAIAIAGALTIYAGYRLFSDASRVRSLVAGAVLALLGLAVLLAGVHKPPVRQARPAWQRNSTIIRPPATSAAPEYLI